MSVFSGWGFQELRLPAVAACRVTQVKLYPLVGNQHSISRLRWPGLRVATAAHPGDSGENWPRAPSAEDNPAGPRRNPLGG